VFWKSEWGGSSAVEACLRTEARIADRLRRTHRAIADYGPDEIRLIRRCQVMATKVFEPEFLRPARELAAAAMV
jgi:hypothetical protein